MRMNVFLLVPFSRSLSSISLPFRCFRKWIVSVFLLSLFLSFFSTNQPKQHVQRQQYIRLVEAFTIDSNTIGKNCKKNGIGQRNTRVNQLDWIPTQQRIQKQYKSRDVETKFVSYSKHQLNAVFPSFSLTDYVSSIDIESITGAVPKSVLDFSDTFFLTTFGITSTTVLQKLVQSPLLTVTCSTVLLVLTTTTVISSLRSSSAPSSPYPNDGQYDPETAAAYFEKRLGMVLSRTLLVTLQSLQFAVAVYKDQLTGNNTPEREEQRGKELATLLTKLGPTFIKVGQSLSIRSDLLSPAYIKGLSTLQDQVPPFDTQDAKRILEREWGSEQAVVQRIVGGTLPAAPIAAASLGQVYKVTLNVDLDDGTTVQKEVAIKIQRPNIMEQIALDMYLLRTVGTVLKRVLKLNTDTVGTVDAWGVGFVNELNYIQEAINGQQFNEKILATPLKDVVFAPTVIQKYSTKNVLVTEWITGERLDQSSSADVSVLCSVAMNTYLTMLLEFGVLHCDPHPGNLLRTPEGKLCILDWGMVTCLDPKLQLTLIEHMAHLTSADYAELPRDLLLLGFVPEEKAADIADSGVVEVLGDIYGAWTAGGGVANIDVNKVIAQLQDLTATKGNLFRIPPYFAYIAKSFSVLEGIGVTNQPGTYSIINECLPYVSKRLLSDNDTMGPALSTFIFGPEKTDSDRIINYKRVKQLVQGFEQYTTSSSGALLGKVASLPRTQLIEEATEQVLDLIFTVEETPLQQILIEQMAKIVSSSGRYLFTELREQSGVLPSGRTLLGTALDPLGLFRTSPLIRTNELDERTIETTRKLLSLVNEQIEKSSNGKNSNPIFDVSTLTRTETIQLSRSLVQKIWQRRLGVFQTGNRFVRTLLQLTADKLERGERDTRRLPSRLSNQKSSTSNSSRGYVALSERNRLTAFDSTTTMDDTRQSSTSSSSSSSTRTFATTSTVPISEGSSRLEVARKRLESLQEIQTSETIQG